MTQPPIGSVWMISYHPDYSSHQLLTVLVLGNSIQHYGAFTRVLLIYSNGNIGEESWSSRTFHLYTLVYSPEERGES